jgi:probable F420-dependent oxidoreductase
LEVGVIFPQTEIEPDPLAIKDFAQAAEDMGYAYIFIADHVLGADSAHHDFPALRTYNHKSVVHETMTLMGYLSAITEQVGLATGILILPQRQTVLVAKQAAEVDVLSGGRLRLGIGVGWNSVEFEALGEDFHNRGARSAEQIEVMRALWTQEVVDYHGKWHNISHAGLNPLPVQRPIPVFLGAGSSATPTIAEPVLKRVARIADGWCPNFGPDERGRAYVEKVHGYMLEMGRDSDKLQLDGRLRTSGKQPEDWIDEAKAWEELGARYLSIENRQGGLKTAGEHIEAMRRFKDVTDFKF